MWSASANVRGLKYDHRIAPSPKFDYEYIAIRLIVHFWYKVNSTARALNPVITKEPVDDDLHWDGFLQIAAKTRPFLSTAARDRAAMIIEQAMET